MSKANWKDAAELVGIAAIVASLFMVAYELRQNTIASQQEAAATYAASTRDLDLFVAGNPEFSSIVQKVVNGQEISSEERFRLRIFYRSVLRTWQDTHYQYLSGTLNKDIWDAEFKFMQDIFESDPGFADYWKVGAAFFTDEFRSLIEQMLEDKKDH